MTASPIRHLWTVILAGGDGVRLRQLTRALHGEECPKQFALIHGGRSLLQSTLARAQSWSAPERTIVVVAEEREQMARAQLRGFGPVELVAQPRNAGTGPGILLPLCHVLARDPEADLVVLPSDHYVRREAPFAQSIRRAVAASRDQVALVGAVPDHAETQYGWISPAARSGPGRGIVARFCEKPAAAVAARLLAEGALWNTFIMAGRAQRFASLASEHLPEQWARFAEYVKAIGTQQAAGVLRAIYDGMPVADFSTDVLQKAHPLHLVPLLPCGWSDWGTPERVLESLRHHSDFAFLSHCLALTATAAAVS
jgi:mannose-1-phosphate guanylyltransferase